MTVGDSKYCACFAGLLLSLKSGLNKFAALDTNRAIYLLMFPIRK
jgi:hypothetical protein